MDTVRAKRQRRSTPKVRTRRPPDLPDDLAPAADPARLFQGREITVSHAVITDVDLGALSAANLRIDTAVLERVALPTSVIAAIRLRDVRLVGCDLANIETRALTAVRVEFVNCHMTGFRTTETCDAEDVLFTEGTLRYSQFVASRFHSCEFVSCNMSDAAFEGADLRGSVFRQCALRNVDLTGAKLDGTDLRSSELENLRLNPKDVYGVVVDPAQAMVLSALLGIRIR